MDNLTEKQRTKCMSNIRSTNTQLELEFRKYIWNKGLRGYRIHYPIAGNPDIYFPKQKIAVFIDGCFWHKCPKCYIQPKSKKDYWLPKIEKNVERDRKINKELQKQGISVLRFWSHEVKENIEKCYLKVKEEHERQSK